MLLVVMVHVLGNCIPTMRALVLDNIIGSFFMPLFFLISGFFAYKSLEKWNGQTLRFQVRNKTSALLISSIVFFALLRFTQNQDIFGWIEKGFGAYWFTVCLFEMCMIYYGLVLISIAVRKDLSLYGMVAISATALCLMTVNPLRDQTIWVMLGGANLCLFIQYFSIGLLINRFKDRIISFIQKDSVITILILTYILFSLMMFTSFEGHPILHKIYSNFAFPYSGLFLVFVLFISNKHYFDSHNYISNGLCIIGSRSLEIYMLHYFFLPSLAPYMGWMAPNSMILLQIIISLMIAVPIIGICITIGNILRKSQFISIWLFSARPNIEAGKSS